MMKYAVPLFLMTSMSPAFAASGSTSDLQYRVVRGDTLDGLARRGLNRWQDYRIVQQHNGIRDPNAIRSGTILRIPRRLLRIEPVFAKVASLRGKVTIDGRPAGMNMPVRAGGTIRTGAISFLTVELADKTVVTVPSNSRMEVLSLGRIMLTGALERRFLLRDGRVEAEVTPLKRKGDDFDIQTPVSVASVRGTRFRVTYQDSTGLAGASVLDGAVAVTGGGEDLLIAGGKGVAIGQQAMRAPEPLLPAPRMRDAGALQDAEQVGFHLETVPDAASYRAQMATDAGFVDLFTEVDAATPNISFEDVPDGSFFVRFTAIAASGIEGNPVSYTVERRRNDLAATVNEASDCPAKRCLLFRWLPNGSGDRTYRFQLLPSPDSVPIFDQAGLSDTEIVVTDLPAGTYVWRVESRGRDGETSFARWSEYEELHVAPVKR